MNPAKQQALRIVAQQRNMSTQVAVTFSQAGSLGLKFTPNNQTGNVEILAVNPGTQAEQMPQLSAGLILTSVAGTSVAGKNYKGCLDLIKAGGRPLSMTFKPGGTVVLTPRAAQAQAPVLSPAKSQVQPPPADLTAWRLANSFAPEEAGCKSWIASPTGALPAELQTWQNEQTEWGEPTGEWADLSLTLTQLVRDSPAQCPPLAASAPSYDKESQDRLEYTQRDMVHAHVSLQHAPRLRSGSGRCMPAALPFTFNQLRVCSHRPPRRTWQRARRRPGLRRTRIG